MLCYSYITTSHSDSITQSDRHHARLLAAVDPVIVNCIFACAGCNATGIMPGCDCGRINTCSDWWRRDKSAHDPLYDCCANFNILK